MNKQNEYVQICVVCCQINSQNRKTLPLVCPKTNMPCFAINPKYLVPDVSEEMAMFLGNINKDSIKTSMPRIPIDCKYIDQKFVVTRCNAFDELARQGNKAIYTLSAY